MNKLKSDNPLGKTGLEVPRIIYGTSYLGNLYTALSYKDKLALMMKWFECTEKPVVIDSAGKYGACLALEIIGRGLQDLGVKKDEVIISNKLGWLRVPLAGPEPTFEPGAWVGLEYDAKQQFGYEEILECYEQGNQLLGGTYKTNLVSVHDPDEYLAEAENQADRELRKQKILESYRALFDLKERGEVLAVGIGSKDWKVIRELYDSVPFDWVMFANSFTIYSHPVELTNFMDELYSNGVGIVNSALFHGGFLTGGNKFDYREISRYSAEGRVLFEWRESFYDVCRNYRVVPADASMHFGMSHPAVASIALNTSRPSKMVENVDILNKKIDPAFWAEMKKRGLINRTCKYL